VRIVLLRHYSNIEARTNKIPAVHCYALCQCAIAQKSFNVSSELVHPIKIEQEARRSMINDRWKSADP
jgi:hypothetical protein